MAAGCVGTSGARHDSLKWWVRLEISVGMSASGVSTVEMCDVSP